MLKGPDKLFKLEQSSRYRTFEITRVNCIKKALSIHVFFNYVTCSLCSFFYIFHISFVKFQGYQTIKTGLNLSPSLLVYWDIKNERTYFTGTLKVH